MALARCAPPRAAFVSATIQKRARVSSPARRTTVAMAAGSSPEKTAPRLDPARATRWHLELTPEKAPLDKILRRLTLFGDGRAVTRIELLEPSGDRTVTKIDAVDPARTFTAAEEREIFGIQSDKARADKARANKARADKARADTKQPREGAPTERRSKLR